MIAAIYLLPGIFGHGPWKQDETYSFGIIHHMLVSGDYLVPTNAGQPFMEKPPLYYWIATVFATALHPWLDYADGARVTTAFFMLITFYVVALTAKAAWQENDLLNPRVLGTLALFAGTLGMVKHAHDMFTDVALVCGSALAMYGLLRLARDMQAKTPGLSAAIWFGLGVGIAEMSKGLFVPIIYAAIACWVGLIVRECRCWSYARLVGVALLVSLPFFVIWPVLLALHSMPLFMAWFWDNNVGRFLGFSVHKLGSDNDATVVLRALAGFALPGAPLAAAAILGGEWRELRQPRVAVPVGFAVVCLILLQISATARQLYLLPLVLPLCLLGSAAIARLPDWLSVGWDWFSRLFFGVIAALVWVVYAISTGLAGRHHDLSILEKWLPADFITPLQPLALGAAILISAIWLLSLHCLKQCGKWRGAFSWFAGITLAWGLAYTLLLPWGDRAKSYEYVYARLTAELSPSWRPGDCMASIGLGESEAPMLFYYAGILHQPVDKEDVTACRWIIVQTPSGAGLPAGVWKQFWSGARDGDRDQTLTVYRRSGTADKPAATAIGES